jgi:chromosome segregation ATPase
MSPESLPSFLNFRPGLNNLRSRLTDLQSDLEHAEERFTTYSQMAAQHGSRIYEMDEDSRYWREIEELGTMAERFTDGADPGVTALERGHDLRICREMEENAAQWAREVERLEREIAHVHRQIEDFENSAP